MRPLHAPPRRPSLALLLTVLLSAAPLAAQDGAPRVRRPDTAYPGAVVRLTTPDGPALQVQGLLTRADDDSVSVAVDGRMVTVPRTAVHRVDVYEGRSLGKGALRGAGIGAAAGFVIGLVGAVVVVRETDNGTSAGSIGGGLIALALPIGGAMTGVIVGAPVGMALAPRRWEPRRLPRSADGAAVGLSIRVP